MEWNDVDVGELRPSVRPSPFGLSVHSAGPVGWKKNWMAAPPPSFPGLPGRRVRSGRSRTNRVSPRPLSRGEGIGDENDRERSGKLNRFRNCIFLSGTETGTEKTEGKTKSVLRNIGNGIIRSGTCRIRSGIGNSRRKNTYDHSNSSIQISQAQ